MSVNRSVGVYQPRSRRAQLAEAIADFRAWIAHLMAETLRRGLGLGLALLSIAILVALASYDSADPGINVATSRAASNWLGSTGAYTADVLLEAIGLSALLLPLPIAAWGWQLLTGGSVNKIVWRLTGLALGLVLLSSGLGALPAIAFLHVGTGGIVGGVAYYFDNKLATALEQRWLLIAISLLFAALGGFLVFLAADIGWSGIKNFGALSYRAARATAVPFRRAFRWRPARKDEDDSHREPEWDEDESGEIDIDEEEEAEGEDGGEDDFDADEPRATPEKRVQRSDDKRKKPPVKTRLQPALNLAEGEYQLPPLSLLTEPPAESNTPAFSDDPLEENARMLEAVLGDFGVRGRIVAVRPGPVVTLYELEPAAGVK